LRHSHDREALLLEETRRDSERVLAADRDQRVESGSLEGLKDAVDAAVELVRVRSRRPENRSAARQDPRDLPRAERLQLLLDESAPPVAPTDHAARALSTPPD